MLSPAVTEPSVGLVESVKSEKNTLNGSVTVWLPLVPVTVRFVGLALVAERPVTLRVLDCPGVIEDGLKEQVAPEEHESVMLEVKLLAAEAVTVKVADVVPATMVSARLLDARLKADAPVPERETVGLPDELLVTEKDPVREPPDVGAK